MLTGGCLCGEIRYEAGGEIFHKNSCHCSKCRRSAGAPYVSWFSVPIAQFLFTKGIPTRYQSSATASRAFCPRCGTQLIFDDDAWPEEIDVTIASLDQPDAVAPEDHTYVSSKLEWVVLSDGLPQYQESRSEG